jgi:hypothetical protein
VGHHLFPTVLFFGRHFQICNVVTETPAVRRGVYFPVIVPDIVILIHQHPHLFRMGQCVGDGPAMADMLWMDRMAMNV